MPRKKAELEELWAANKAQESQSASILRYHGAILLLNEKAQEDYEVKRAECRELTAELIGHHIRQQSTKDKQSMQDRNASAVLDQWAAEEVEKHLAAAGIIGKEQEQARREISGARKSLKRGHITLH